MLPLCRWRGADCRDSGTATNVCHTCTLHVRNRDHPCLLPVRRDRCEQNDMEIKPTEPQLGVFMNMNSIISAYIHRFSYFTFDVLP